MSTTKPSNTTKTPTKTKIPIKSIRITQVEGGTAPAIHATVVTLAAAKTVLGQICANAPKDGGYWKVDYVVTFSDGNVYCGRYDASYPTARRHEGTELGERMRSTLLYHAGLCCPKHMDEEKYRKTLTPKSIADATAFLTNYSLVDVVTSADAQHAALATPVDLSDQVAQLAKMTAQITRMLDDDATLLSRHENLPDATKQSARAYELRKALVAIQKALDIK